MRNFILGIAGCLAVCAAGPAYAGGKFECIWNATPGAEASVTGGPALDPDTLSQALQTCGLNVTDENTWRLGVYFAMHHVLTESGASLQATYPGVTDKLDADAKEVSPAESAEIVAGIKAHSPPPPAFVTKATEFAKKAGIRLSDGNALPAARRYIFARAIMAELEAEA